MGKPLESLCKAILLHTIPYNSVQFKIFRWESLCKAILLHAILQIFKCFIVRNYNAIQRNEVAQAEVIIP